jgi:hypothetical protein
MTNAILTTNNGVELKISQYKSASNHLVTLYENKLTGQAFTVVDGNITIYNRNGDMVCGATSIEAAIRLISE